MRGFPRGMGHYNPAKQERREEKLPFAAPTPTARRATGSDAHTKPHHPPVPSKSRARLTSAVEMKFVCVPARSQPAPSFQIIPDISFSRERAKKEFSAGAAATATEVLLLLTVISCNHFICYFGHRHFLHKHTADI